MFHQSGGCCDNSSPNCYLPTDLTVGPYDLKLGEIGGVPFYMGAAQYEYWKHTQLIIDVVAARAATSPSRRAAARPSSPARACSPTTNGTSWKPPASSDLTPNT
jgi:uncharacterized protein (DUF779 family)